MDADHKRAMIEGLRRAGRASAEARRCPNCNHKSATKTSRDLETVTIYTECRWCHWYRRDQRVAPGEWEREEGIREA